MFSFNINYNYYIIFQLLLITKLINCFNFDTNFPIVYKNPLLNNINVNVDDYFGYVVSLYGGDSSNDSWLQISAPKEDDTISNGSGMIYRCKLFEPCKRLNIEPVLTRVKARSESRQNQWLGVSMDVDVQSKRDVVCSHKVLQIPKYYVPGKCYWSHLDENYKRLDPLGNDMSENAVLNGVFNYAMGQAGLSARFVNITQNATQLLIGAPGVYNWYGTVISYLDTQDVFPETARTTSLLKKRQIFYETHNNFRNVDILSPLNFIEPLPFSFTGYSLTAGHFFSKVVLSYAIGSPAYAGYGRITIGQWRRNNYEVKKGLQFGEYFGAALAAGDINNDGYDDLIIGAPYYTNEKYNEGRIFVYHGSEKGILEVPRTGSRIEGNSDGGQFGNSIMFLEDVDLDGFNEVAVASPYSDDGTGIVYIYRCTEKGLNPEPTQRLLGKDVNPTIKGFGISISKAVDVDGNHYRDIAIGAYKSSEVVLYRSRPVVVLKHRLKTAKYKINIEDKFFSVNYCLNYIGQHLPSSIRVKRTLIVDDIHSRAVLSNVNVTELKVLKRNALYCEDVEIKLKDNIVNFDEPIIVQLSQTLDEYKLKKSVVIVKDKRTIGKDPFCKECVYQDREMSEIVRKLIVPFSLNCGSDDKCESKLSFTAEFANLPNKMQYVIGSQDYVKLHIKLQNFGEKAFFVRVEVGLPEGVNFKNNPNDCEQQHSRDIICLLTNLILEKDEKSLTLDLNMKEIKNVNGILKFNVTSLTSSVNLYPPSKIIELSVIQEADVTIVGASNEQSYYINLQNDTKKFIQTFQIQKFGVSPIDIIRADFWIPIALKSNEKKFLKIRSFRGTQRNELINCGGGDIDYMSGDKSDGNDQLELYDPTIVNDFNRTRRDLNMNVEHDDDELYPSNRTFYLNVTDSTLIYAKVSCTAGPFVNRQDDINIVLDMEFISNEIYNMLGIKDIIIIGIKGNVTIESPIDFKQYENRTDTIHVQSIFIKEMPIKSTLWILILSILIGLILLLLVIFGLYKAGFFKRAKKDELEALKKNETKQINDLTEDMSVPDLQDDQMEKMIMDEGDTTHN